MTYGEINFHLARKRSLAGDSAQPFKRPPYIIQTTARLVERRREMRVVMFAPELSARLQLIKRSVDDRGARGRAGCSVTAGKP
jgi:hypothetical protein